MTTQRQLTVAAKRLAGILKQRDLRIVLAESCTGGLVSAALTRIPGISAHHCGSAVVYRVETKAAWLGIPAALLKRPGPVSRVVAARMAEGVLARTAEADVAASVTGHLGPDAPKHQDGLIYVAVAFREAPGKAGRRTIVARHRLGTGNAASVVPPAMLRRRRQAEAACFVLTRLANVLEAA